MSWSRRSFIQAASTVAVAGATGAFDAARAMRIKPSRATNIVYIHSHDSGRYLSPYGYATPTPRLLGLAREGALFRQMHCASPTCSSSRAAMLTGQSAHSSGMLGLAHRGWRLREPRRHIVHTLRANGYRTVLAGLQHVAVDPVTIGYDAILQRASARAHVVAPAAADFLRSPAASEAPFFLDVGFFETHRAFPPAVDDPAFVQPPSPIPDTVETREDMAGYYASARAMDAGTGQVLDALAAAGLAENTLVISTTDHGLPFPAMKHSLRDTGTGVSMIMRGPGAFARPRAYDALLSQIDVFPTLTEYLGIEPPEWLEGQSFMPIVRGTGAEVHECIFAETNFHSAYEPARSVRTQRYKYIRRFDGRTTPVLPNTDAGASKTLWVRNGWANQPLTSDSTGEELYDLMFDPNERTNISQRPEAAAIIARMRIWLKDWMTRTQDPLIGGPIAIPPGVRSDSPNLVDPAI